MAIEIITNSVWGASTRILATNGSDVAHTIRTGIENMTGGPRHLYYTGAGTGTLRAVYLNKAGGLSADRCVIARADRNAGHGLSILAWSAYPSSSSSLYSSSNFAGPFVGPRSQDSVFDLGTQTGKQAFGVQLSSGSGGSYAKTLQQVFFGTAFRLPWIERLSRTLLPRFARQTVQRRMSYMVRERIELTAGNLSRTDVAAFKALHKIRTDPFFLHDPAGIQLRDKLVYGVMDGPPVETVFDDLHTLTITFFVLEYWV